MPIYGPSSSGSVATDTIWDAKGDLAVATGADAAARVALGTVGDVLGVTGTSATAGWVKKLHYYKMPTGAIAETIDREALTQVTAPTTATITMNAIELEAGMVVSNFKLRTAGTAMAAGTNQWIALFDSSRVQVACTADQGLAVMGSLTDFTWPVATIASGASATYTVPTAGLYYVGIMLKAGTVCNIPAAQTIVSQTAPILCGTSNAGQTTPNAFPFTASAITSGGAYYHIWVT